MRIGVLDPTNMRWFLHITTPYADLHHHQDPRYEAEDSTAAQGMTRCEHVDAEGTLCTYEGTPAQVGVHKFYKHGQGNPMKALVLTNQCPGCYTWLASTRSAKEHANRAWKRGGCPTHQSARPYSFDVQECRIEHTIACNVCKEEITGHDAIMTHMNSHFLELAPPPSAGPSPLFP